MFSKLFCKFIQSSRWWLELELELELDASTVPGFAVSSPLGFVPASNLLRGSFYSELPSSA